jgi:hypothetical protein
MKLHLEKASWLIVVVDFVWQTELAGEFTIVAESLYIIFVAPKSAMIYKCKRLGSSFDTRYLDVCKHAQRKATTHSILTTSLPPCSKLPS